MRNNWLYLITDSNDGTFNMSCDEYLLNSLIKGDLKYPILRLYSWIKPTISLGVNQQKQFQSSHVLLPTVKRITGGQAVLHGIPQNELTYSVCLMYKKNAKQLYFEIGEALLNFLSKFNLIGDFGYSKQNYINEFDCFNSRTPADIVVDDIKIIGSAQCRRKEYILQHGSIRLTEIKKLSTKEFDYKSAILYLRSSFEETLKINFLNYSLTEKDYETISLNVNSFSMKDEIFV